MSSRLDGPRDGGWSNGVAPRQGEAAQRHAGCRTAGRSSGRNRRELRRPLQPQLGRARKMNLGVDGAQRGLEAVPEGPKKKVVMNFSPPVIGRVGWRKNVSLANSPPPQIFFRMSRRLMVQKSKPKSKMPGITRLSKNWWLACGWLLWFYGERYHVELCFNSDPVMVSSLCQALHRAVAKHTPTSSEADLVRHV